MNYIWFYLVALIINPSQLNIEDYTIIYNRADYIQVLEDKILEDKIIEDPIIEEIIKEDKIKEKTLGEVEEYIEKYSKKYEVDVDLAKNIAWCESNYYQYAKNASSSAEGVFQFIDGTWMYTMELMNLATTTDRKMEIPLSIEAGVFLLSEEGSYHWNASKHCWGNM